MEYSDSIKIAKEISICIRGVCLGIVGYECIFEQEGVKLRELLKILVTTPETRIALGVLACITALDHFTLPSKNQIEKEESSSTVKSLGLSGEEGLNIRKDSSSEDETSVTSELLDSQEKPIEKQLIRARTQIFYTGKSDIAA